MRLRKGDHVILIDGQGGMVDAVITIPDPGHCTLEITRIIEHGKERSFSLHIAIAPTKNMERFEWFIEKSVEIGIDTITPLLCQRSERKNFRTDRLQKLIISTMKQAGIPYLAELQELTDVKIFLKELQGYRNNRFIAHCEDGEKRHLQHLLCPKTNVIILIGPEGDFSPGEIDLAVKYEFMPVTLGQNRLRTETAGIVACNIVNLINEDNP
jgi:16S rRNA (uracil1498-N3)-methyltransferase